MKSQPPPLLGKYKTPRFRYGAIAKCQVRGEVIIVGVSNARIAWPIGRPRGARTNGYIVYRDLVSALRRESAQAMQYWFGLGHDTITRLRQELGIHWLNEGTRQAYLKAAKLPSRRANIQKAMAKARDPERCEKIAAAHRGRKRPPHLLEAMRRGRFKGGPRRHGKSWSASEDAAVLAPGTCREVGERIGGTAEAVQNRRKKLRHANRLA